jgi:hypothetical protein
VPIVLKYGSLNLLEPSRPVMGLLTYILYMQHSAAKLKVQVGSCTYIYLIYLRVYPVILVYVVDA